MENENGTGNAFDFFDFTEDEAAEALTWIAETDKRTGHICVCGHPVGRHTYVPARNRYTCSANKNNCKCAQNRPVIEVENARLFLRKTIGTGAMHALGQGIKAALDAGQNIEWLVPQQCDMCKKPGKVSPVAVNFIGDRIAIMNTSTESDGLLCAECRVGKLS